MATKSNQLTVTGQFENLAKISNFIVQAARQAGLDEQGIYAIQLAVDEACTNIIEHGYGTEHQGDIHLHYQLKPDGLQITIHDNAPPFDPAQVPEPDINVPLSERPVRGMGLFLIRRLVDRLEITSTPGQGNQTILFKQRQPANS